MKFGCECSLRSIKDQQEPPFEILDVFSSETFDDSHWAVALRTLWDSRLV